MADKRANKSTGPADKGLQLYMKIRSRLLTKHSGCYVAIKLDDPSDPIICATQLEAMNEFTKRHGNAQGYCTVIT